MLSGETAVGKHPAVVVSTMDGIIRRVESDSLFDSVRDMTGHPLQRNSSDAVAAAADQVANTISAKAIACYTTHGSTAVRLSRSRPHVPILSLTPSVAVARQLAMCWGVVPVLCEDATDMEDMVSKALAATKARLGIKGDDKVVVTAGMPFGRPGNTNTLRIARLEEIDG